MAESFTSVKIERSFYSGRVLNSWVDLTPDVLHDPPPVGSIGIMSNTILDRVADGGSFSFSLDNSASNSQATLGYYSTSVGINYGNLIRVSFTYDGRKVYKWFGYVMPDGIKIVPGVRGARRVDVRCRDWFGLISEFPLDFMPYSLDKNIGTAARMVVESLPDLLRPAHVNYQTGDYNFPDVFDLMKGETTASGEFNKLAISELGWIFATGNDWDGLTFHALNRLYYDTPLTESYIFKTSSETTDLFLLANATDKLILANGSDLLLLTETQQISFDDNDVVIEEGFESTYGNNFANYIKVQITPRVVDAAATTVLWTMESSMKVSAGQTVGPFRCSYRDPNNGPARVNGIEMVTPVANTDYKAYENENGTGSDLTASLSVSVTFGTAEAEYSLTNTGGTDLYTGGENILFQFRGKGVYVYDTTDIIINNEDETALGAGRKIMTFPMVYYNDPVVARAMIVNNVANTSKTPDYFVQAYPLWANRNKKNMQAFMRLEPGMTASFSETITTYDAVSIILGYSFEIRNMKDVIWRPCLWNGSLISDL